MATMPAASLSGRRLGRHPSLRWNLFVYVVLPLALALALGTYQSLRVLEGWIKANLQDEVALVARTLQLPLSRGIERLDLAALDDALEAAFRLNRVFAVALYDSAGRAFASAGMEPTEPLPDRVLNAALAGRQQDGYGRVADQTVYSYFVPLRDAGGRPTGVLQVARLASDFETTIAGLRTKVAVLLLAAALAMTGIVLWGHYLAIGRPLDRLAASMARVAGGQRTHRSDVHGPREVAALERGFNHMLDSIDRAGEELERRHQVQADLERRLQHAERMAALGRLAAGVAHELGAPLSIVDGKAQRLLRQCRDSAKLADSLHDIRREVGRMEVIVRQLLDFGRNQGQHRRRLGADRLAEIAVNAVRESFAESGTRLEVRGNRPAPCLSANPMRIEQALVNLLNNARQATPGGRVRLSWASRGDGVEFRVEDDGPGVDPDIRRRIFEPFFTTKEVGQGSGLGLSIVHSVADEHQGEAEVGDSPLGGAAFRLRLPRLDSDNGGRPAPTTHDNDKRCS